jgi:hypothetical protein
MGYDINDDMLKQFKNTTHMDEISKRLRHVDRTQINRLSY